MRLLGQQAGDAKAGRHYGEVVLVFELSRHFQRGRAHIQRHAVPILHQLGRLDGNALFFFGPRHAAIEERRLITASPRADGPAMHPMQKPLPGQRIQIAAHGHLRHPKPIHQIGHRHRILRFQKLKNGLMALLRKHDALLVCGCV